MTPHKPKVITQSQRRVIERYLNNPVARERVQEQEDLEIRIAYKICDQMNIQDAWEFFQRTTQYDWRWSYPAEVILIEAAQNMLCDYFSELEKQSNSQQPPDW